MEETKQSRRKPEELSDREQKNVPLIDRISALPDEVVCHILSFLPTRISVSTSILAKRWRSLWAYVPILDFGWYGNYSLLKSLPDIISKVMSLHKGGNISTFRLPSEFDCSDYELEKWIATVIARNVRILDVSLHDQVRLPQCLFTCKTLVNLSLDSCGDIPMTAAVYLPSLKKLYFHMGGYVSDESLPYLLSGCPVLEELLVGSDTPLNVVVCSPTLTGLVLKLEPDFDFENQACYGVKLDTPALRYLLLCDTISEHFSARSLTSLTEADIFLGARIGIMSEVERTHFYARSVLEFVGNTCNIKCLRLSLYQMLLPDSAFYPSTIKLLSITELELHADWRFISIFLENADNLEVLKIYTVDGDFKCWTEPEQVPACMVSHLGMVSIDGLGCLEQEFDMVRYILRNSKILKRMEIRCVVDEVDSEIEARKRISLFERGSEACRIAFH
ncbi:hypothetical protein OROMI_019925 [Orobanche minor]